MADYRSQAAELLRANPNLSEDDLVAALGQRQQADAASAPTPLTDAWHWANTPLVSPDLGDSFLGKAGRTVAELATTPANVLGLGLGLGAQGLGRMGLTGASRVARIGEAALQAPMMLEGAQIAGEGLRDNDPVRGIIGAGEVGLGALGVKQAGVRLPEARAARQGLGSELGAMPAARPMLPEAPAVPELPSAVGSPAAGLPSGTAAASPLVSQADLDELVAQIHAGGTSRGPQGQMIDMKGENFASLWPERQFTKPVAEFQPQMAADWIAANQDLLTKDPRARVGGWVTPKDGVPTVYMDVSMQTPHFGPLRQAARRANQLEVFRSKDFSTVPVVKTQPPDMAIPDWPLEERFNAVPQDDDMLRFEHRSPLGDLSELDPELAHKGPSAMGSGAELKRRGLKNYPARAYVTPEGGFVEHRFRNLPNVYDGEISKHLIYDMEADPEGFKAALSAEHPYGGPELLTAIEAAVKDAGYAGYQADHAVAMFDKVPVRKRQAPALASAAPTPTIEANPSRGASGPPSDATTAKIEALVNRQFAVRRNGTVQLLRGPDAANYTPKPGEDFGVFEGRQFKLLQRGTRAS